ncbi:MAG TPA: hypothetical protein VNB24_02225 [Acidimicrobiales bacterium]|nr:hypothetical protein [Acidimicrobiales bacterium]
MELSGGWRAAVATEALRREYPEVSYDDGGWEPVSVPGQWRSTAAFADADGPLLYRSRFDFAAPDEANSRHWLTFDGIFYTSDVWLDGGYVGDTEGYFMPHSFDVTDTLRARSNHTLAVEVTCSAPSDRTAKRNITGVFQHWDCLDPDDNPGGIWRPVRLETTGPVRIAAFRALCPQATPERAVVAMTATLDAATACSVTLRTRVGDVDHELDQQLAAGANILTWSVTIDDPVLWWPHALGDANLTDVTVTVHIDGEPDSAPSDHRSVRTGLRQIAARDFIWTVNGERLFLKGVNHGPTTPRLADASAEQVRSDIERAREANLDLVRVHAHIARPELYAAADELGVLLWQDFPLQWGYARGLRKQAARQARAAVDLLGHHPSIAVWCGHNEPLAIDTGVGGPADRGKAVRQFIVGQQLPTWNKTILDASVKRAFEKADNSRPVIAHSGVLPGPTSGGTDAHLYFGWYHGNERDLPGVLSKLPRLARFVSEFGAQAVPESADFCGPEQWPDLDWDRLALTHALQYETFERYVPPSDYATFDDWRDATQAYQAIVLKHHIETLRRLKYRPAGGFAAFLWADAHPAVTWSVLGHDRQPKAGHAALVAACAPVIVVADRPAEAYSAGDTLDLDVHVVSDLRHDIDDLEVEAVVVWPGGHEGRQTWRGACPADTCVKVGTVELAVPRSAGPASLLLELRGAGLDADNFYRFQVLADEGGARG